MAGELNTVPVNVLAAVNLMLTAIGRANVASLTSSHLNEDATKALTVLDTTSFEVQSRGWHYNTEKSYPLDPAVDGTITVPSNFTKVVLAGSTRGKNLAQRGQRLYDLDNHTYVIGETVYAAAVVILDFEEIPTPIRWYATCLAARRYGVAMLPTGATFQFTETDVGEAKRLAEDFDYATEDRYLPEANEHFRAMRKR